MRSVFALFCYIWDPYRSVQMCTIGAYYWDPYTLNVLYIVGSVYDPYRFSGYKKKLKNRKYLCLGMVGFGLVLCMNMTVLCLSSTCFIFCICAIRQDLFPAVGFDVPTSLL